MSIALKPINLKDIELLRKWKNENRMYFFNKNIISSGEQVKWFEDFLKRENDYMFIIEFDGLNVGCIGFRLIDDVIDIYNVIIGDKRFLSKDIMRSAFALMYNFIINKYKNDITVKVLINNPARKWYEKNNFFIVYEKEDYVFMKLNREIE